MSNYNYNIKKDDFTYNVKNFYDNYKIFINKAYKKFNEIYKNVSLYSDLRGQQLKFARKTIQKHYKTFKLNLNAYNKANSNIIMLNFIADDLSADFYYLYTKQLANKIQKINDTIQQIQNVFTNLQARGIYL